MTALDPSPNPYLCQAHYNQLVVGSAIDPAVVQERGYSTIATALQLAAMGLASAPVPGIVVPVWPPRATEPAVFTFRPDQPGDGLPKYKWPFGQPMRLDVPRRCHERLKDSSTRLFVVEGLKKADALASRGLCVVAVFGTWCFGHRAEPGAPILSDWELIRLNGREVIIPYDSDVSSNAHVNRARHRLTSFVKHRGAIPKWITFAAGPTGAKTGADDFFANGGTIEEFLALIEDPADDPFIAASLDDLGAAERFVYAKGDIVRWCVDRRLWLTWDDRRWDSSNQDRPDFLAKEVARETQMAAASMLTSNPRRDAVLNHANKMGGIARLEAMVSRAKSEPEIQVFAHQLDTNPWSLTVLNGEIDLRTGTLSPHDPASLSTQLCPVEFDPKAQSDDWDRFIDLFTGGNRDLATYLQRVSGYCCTGLAKEGSIFFFLGPTRTGKTTFLRALTGTLGDYSWKSAFDSFLSGRRPGTVRDDIAAMESKRLVIASEVSSGQRLDEGLVKELTGEDYVNARGLYQGGKNFRPVLKLMLAANDFPHVRSDDSGSWSRMNLIPCQSQELQKREHVALKQRVMDIDLTGAAILSWAIQGCLDWQREDDLARPEVVDQAVKEQREEFEPLREFLSACCVIEEGAREDNHLLRSAYVSQCKDQGEKYPIGPKRFTQELRALGFEQQRSGARGWKGLRLLTVREEMKRGRER